MTERERQRAMPQPIGHVRDRAAQSLRALPRIRARGRIRALATAQVLLNSESGSHADFVSGADVSPFGRSQVHPGNDAAPGTVGFGRDDLDARCILELRGHENVSIESNIVKLIP